MTMTEPQQPTTSTEPVGHGGTRVEIEESAARSLPGWLGLIVVAVCVVVVVVLATDSATGTGALFLPSRSSWRYSC